VPATEETLIEKPLISLMLLHRRDLSLSPEQVHELEGIRDTYQREAIRHDADLRIAELDLQRVLRADAVDLEHARMKFKDIERLKVELRLARIGAIEKAKRLLSSDQRATLSTLLGAAEYSPSGDKPLSEPAQDQR
jgi:Spy/CpxP family protein refolding chaperone